MSSQGQQVAENGDITSDINDQASNLEKGLTSMPLDAAKDSIQRWQQNLSKLSGPGISDVTSKLGDLSSALGGQPDGQRIATILSDLSSSVQQVASGQSGGVQSALNKLADALKSGASSLK